MGNLGQAVATAALPDSILVVLAGACALIGFLRPGHRPSLFRWIACLALAGAVAASGFELFGMRTVRSGVGLDTFGGGFVADHLSVYVTITACLLAFVTCLLSDSYVRRIPSRASAFFALVLVCTAAVSALAGQHDGPDFVVLTKGVQGCHELGDHLAALERLKRKLAAEGLFAAERKRPLPLLPRRIGLVTGNDAAAKRDVLTVITTRFPPASVLVAETYVQGPRAAGASRAAGRPIRTRVAIPAHDLPDRL